MPTNVTRTPNANNNMGAFETYVKRLLYNTRAYRNVGAGLSGPVKDFRFGERMLYGRVDTMGQPVKLKETSLKRIKGSRNSVRLVDFVADAFSDMRKKILSDVTSGKIPADIPYISNFSPKRGYQSLKKFMKEHNDGRYQAFKQYVDLFNLDEKLTDFDSYMPCFMDFCRSTSDFGFSTTLTNFTKSRLSSPLTTGLIVDIADDVDFSEDSVKVNFVRNPYFSYYSEIARTHGFSIDKHIPFRLVADLESPFMKKYMKGNTTVNGILTKYYSPAHLDGYDQFKSNIVDMYRQYINQRPRIMGHKLDKNGTLIPGSKRRKSTSLGLELEQKGESFFLEQYIEIRNSEEGGILEHARKEYLKKRSTDVINSFDVNTALKYIESEFTTTSTEANSFQGIKNRLGMT